MRWVMVFANYQDDNNALFMLKWILTIVYFFTKCYKLKKHNSIWPYNSSLDGNLWLFFHSLLCLEVVMTVMFFCLSF